MIDPDEQILICAVRYALGRMSYITFDVGKYVELKTKHLSTQCIKIIAKDIEEELERYHAAGQPLGMKCDDKMWTMLLENLKGELNERNQR